MKRIILIFLVFVFAATSHAAGSNLYETFKGTSEIRVYLKEVTNDTENPNVKVETFKSTFKDVLAKRLNFTFIPVNAPGKADVIVTAEIKSYVFREKVSPSIFGVAALVADATAPKAAAKLVVDYTITSPEGGRTLLEFKSFTTDARHPQKEMKAENAFAYAANKSINRFIYRSFHKQKRKR